MKSTRIAAWLASVGVSEASKRTGVSLSTLGRYATGETQPRGSQLILVTTAVEAWESAQEEAK